MGDSSCGFNGGVGFLEEALDLGAAHRGQVGSGTGLLTGDGLLEALLDKRFEPSSAK
jgi:hypothetical protein